ncbi:MAG TPA: hypothetical protein VGR78_11570 [Verrucomicrobiae bacterium]|jgi:hypothetical protein|nr:hypothetical protein [Verrucomicrobiae bacterium]
MRFFAAILLAAFLAPRAPALDAAGRTGILQFLDNSSLHGVLSQIDETNGLKWAYPGAKTPLQFSLSNVASLRFEKAEPAPHAFTAACRFHFRNGDELIGNIREIKEEKLHFQSWFGDNVEASIDSLSAIMFSSKGYNLLYEGPTSLDGWRTTRSPKSWEYKDGAFIANGADQLGRDFALSGSATLEFDLSWNGAFSLMIALYAQNIDRFDYTTSAYLVYLGTGAISVQRVQAGAGAIMLGQTQVPEMLRRNRMHFEIRCNKEDATISLFADGKFIQRWKDNNPGGFIAKGGGILFFSQVEPRSLKLSNIRVAEWDGRYEPDAQTNAPPNMDVVFLANRDKVFGKVTALEETRATVETKQTRLDIPLARVTQIRFANESSLTNSAPGEVRASFPGGERVVFKLEKWDGKEVKGTSKTFGALAFDPKNIREVQFNLSRTLAPVEQEPKMDLEFLEAE